ncbi:Multidrug-efflux transporter 3 [Slackia heliotrinireducens]|uniref:Arabinose efflux permease family protein n=1 Tax=Slackia heliotrinireducens (strain ATCC 29202 / DSM 20476 / NCTC 11029 / RHS 1) TaxID=471855 RepID=C7N1W3_SLAHD|nr:MFS transporter [Slackia heliotrinireducens]ACV23404.1 arabinose efflux permease family protein [Slackia heliotrinireducens DSM 20476]VEH02697.1 Multidrug-efflux transporter 3 [Slackia heliotrinireducens]
MEQRKFGRIAAVYLAGLLIGGLYVGLIAPLRTVIQADLGFGSSMGIWMVNIYTLFYAALIPVSGKLADIHGRKKVFSVCLLVFAAGALLCGLSQVAGSFVLLLVGRVIQAAGAGGIIPVATAEMGVSAPEEKRGMWLGMAAAVSGISNVLGAAVGSLVVAAVGLDSWGWAFFMCVPVCALLEAGAVLWLPDNDRQVRGRLDIPGSILLVAFLVLLLLGLTGLDFFALKESLGRPSTWVPLATALVLGVAFVLVERSVFYPMFHLEYFTDRNIALLMAASFFVGCVIISMVLIPEFAEAALGAETGSGGYYMAILGVFAVVGPPMGGKIIDKHGAKPVFIGGSLVSAAGYAFLALFVTAHPSVAAMVFGLALVGLGMGFTMGTPLNYLMLHAVPEGESSSAIATMSLIRQIGTTVAPAVFVGFVSAGAGLSGYAGMLLAVAASACIAMLLVALIQEK